MTKKLLIVFASGIVLTLVAFSLAFATGGNELRSALKGETDFNWHLGEEYKGPKKDRSFAVDGGQTLTMEVPVELHFVRGKEARMVVTGPAEAVDRRRWSPGQPSAACQALTRRAAGRPGPAPAGSGSARNDAPPRRPDRSQGPNRSRPWPRPRRARRR